MLSADFHIVTCSCYMYTSSLNVPLPRLSLCVIALLQSKLLLSDVLAMGLSLDSSHSCFLQEQQDSTRKTARRGKRRFSDRGYVRRSQPTVNFEIRTL